MVALVSSTTIFNEMRRRRPDLLQLLFEPVATDRSASVFAARLYPNPPRRRATLELVTTRPGFARVHLYDAQGRVARTLLDDTTTTAMRTTSCPTRSRR